MRKLIFTLAITMLALGVQTNVFAAEMAAGGCEAQAVSKDGKKLAGAAKASFMKKCEATNKAQNTNGCEEKAVGKNGKKLAGAAKTAFMKKCEADAKPAQ